MKRIALAIALFLLPLTAQAHDHTEIQEWEWDWQARAERVYQEVREKDSLSVSTIEKLADLNAERVDFESRHPCHYTGDCGTPEAQAASELSPAAVPSSYVWMDSVEEWRPLVAGHFAPEDVDTVLCLMEYESAGNPGAINPSSGASGLMQVMPDWAPKFGMSRSDLLIPEKNLYIAAQLKADGGWSHWSPYNRGNCHGL